MALHTAIQKMQFVNMAVFSKQRLGSLLPVVVYSLVKTSVSTHYLYLQPLKERHLIFD